MKYYCHRHGVQESRPCPHCKAAEYSKPRVRGGKGMAMREATLAMYGHRCAALVPYTGNPTQLPTPNPDVFDLSHIDMGRCDVHAPLEVHHVDGDPSNDAPANRVPLCPPHHRALAGKPRSAFAGASTPFVL